MSTSKVGILGGGEVIERYSLEHVEGIRNEGQRANSIPYLWEIGRLRQ